MSHRVYWERIEKKLGDKWDIIEILALKQIKEIILTIYVSIYGEILII